MGGINTIISPSSKHIEPDIILSVCIKVRGAKMWSELYFAISVLLLLSHQWGKKFSDRPQAASLKAEVKEYHVVMVLILNCQWIGRDRDNNLGFTCKLKLYMKKNKSRKNAYM